MYARGFTEGDDSDYDPEPGQTPFAYLRADPDSWVEIMKFVQDKGAQQIIRLICKDAALYYPDWMGEAMQVRYHEIYLDPDQGFPFKYLGEDEKPAANDPPKIREAKQTRYDALTRYSNEYSDAVDEFKWATCRELIEKAQLAVEEAHAVIYPPVLESPRATPTA